MGNQLGESPYYENLSGHPEEAFLQLEEIFKVRAEKALANCDDDSWPAEALLNYVSGVLAAKTALGLEILEGWRLPSPGDFDINTYHSFCSDVTYCKTLMQVRLSVRRNDYSVCLEPAKKIELHFHLEQVRAVFLEMDVPDRKREALLSRLEALEREIDRDRTRFDIVASLLIDSAGALGEAATKLEPLTKAIAKIFWGAKEDERARLPAPEERKRIEAPTRDPPKKKEPNFGRDLDDEVPF